MSIRKSSFILILISSFISIISSGETTSLFERNAVLFTSSVVHIPGFGGNRNVNVTEGRFGLGQYFRTGLGGYADFHLAHYDGERGGLDIDANGIAMTFQLRWHFINWQRWGALVNYGPGLLYTFEEFPPGGTNFNFMYQFGLGMNLALRDNMQAVVGVRDIHISNGKGPVDENPTFEGIGLYAQLLLKTGLSKDNKRLSSDPNEYAAYKKPAILTEFLSGSIDEEDYISGEIRVGIPIQSGIGVQFDATAGDLASEQVTEFGLHVFHRSSHYVYALYYGRKEYAAFKSDLLSAQLEHISNDILMVKTGLSYERDNFDDDHLLGGILLDWYFADNFLFRSGMATAKILDDDFRSDDISLRIGLEWQPLQIGDFGLSLVAEQWLADDVEVAGVRIAWSAGKSLKELRQTGFLSRLR